MKVTISIDPRTRRDPWPAIIEGLLFTHDFTAHFSMSGRRTYIPLPRAEYRFRKALPNLRMRLRAAHRDGVLYEARA